MREYEDKDVMTVADLRSLLDGADPGMFVGGSGHFGEFVPIRKGGVNIRDSYLAPDGWQRADGTPTTVVIVEGLDVGPDPEGDEGWD